VGRVLFSSWLSPNLLVVATSSATNPPAAPSTAHNIVGMASYYHSHAALGTHHHHDHLGRGPAGQPPMEPRAEWPPETSYHSAAASHDEGVSTSLSGTAHINPAHVFDRFGHVGVDDVDAPTLLGSNFSNDHPGAISHAWGETARYQDDGDHAAVLAGGRDAPFLPQRTAASSMWATSWTAFDFHGREDVDFTPTSETGTPLSPFALPRSQQGHDPPDLGRGASPTWSGEPVFGVYETPGDGIDDLAPTPDPVPPHNPSAAASEYSFNTSSRQSSPPTAPSSQRSSVAGPPDVAVARTSSKKRPVTCTNCTTQTTPLWRRNSDGQPLCNACGLFLKLHGVMRPLSLRTDVFKTRKRRGGGRSSADGTTTRSKRHSSG